MSGRNLSVLRRRELGAITAAFTIALAGACSGGGLTIQPGPTEAPLVYPRDTPYNGPAPGTWTGTITFTGSVSYDKTEPGHSDLDPNNTYYELWVDTETTQESATDTFTVTATDDDDLTYGIRSIELDGSVANSGNTQQRSVRLTDKRNSGCTWKQEDGSETSGSWSGSGDATVLLNFQEDGAYDLHVRTSPNGYAEVPGHDWLKYSDISADCEVNYPEFDDPSSGSPLVDWVSTEVDTEQTVGNLSKVLEGQLNASSPGTVIDGTKSWEFQFPEGYEVTVTWHLVHSTPITLPHS